MNASLRRTLALVAAGLIVWGGWYGWMSWKTSQTINALKDVARSADLNKLLSDPPEEVKSSVDLAVRGIMLSQGRDGRKSFDLKAEWATLNQDSGAITMREPDIAYRLSDDENGSPRLVLATAKIGRVEDGNQKVSMSDDVRARHEDKVLIGDLAVFLNPLNKLIFPGGADLIGDEIDGSCNQLTWDLNTNIILGNHGVKMRWYPPMREEDTPAEDNTAQPSDAANGAQEAR
jgi:hypothetical protein